MCAGVTQLVYSSLLASEAQGPEAAEQYRPVADMAALRAVVQEAMSKPAAGRQAVLPDCSWTAALAARACSALSLPGGALSCMTCMWHAAVSWCCCCCCTQRSLMCHCQVHPVMTHLLIMSAHISNNGA
jgi:hypothetical protein